MSILAHIFPPRPTTHCDPVLSAARGAALTLSRPSHPYVEPSVPSANKARSTVRVRLEGATR